MAPFTALMPDAATREILSWAGGGVVAVLTGLWAVFKNRSQKKKFISTSAPASADSGSVAIGRDAVNSPITISHKDVI